MGPAGVDRIVSGCGQVSREPLGRPHGVCRVPQEPGHLDVSGPAPGWYIVGVQWVLSEWILRARSGKWILIPWEHDLLWVLRQNTFRGSKAPQDADLSLPWVHACLLPSVQPECSEAAFSRGPHLQTRVFDQPCICPGPAPGVEPPALSFTKEAPLDLQTESI